METYPIYRAHTWSKMFPAAFCLTPGGNMPKRGFTLLLTKVQTSLLNMVHTRVFLGQSMWYDHLPQTPSKGGSQEKMTANSSPHHQVCCRSSWCGFSSGLQRPSSAMLLVYWGHGLSCTLPAPVLAGVWSLRVGMRATLHVSTTHCKPWATEHGPLVGVSTPDQTGKNSPTKQALNSLWTVICIAPQ